VQSFGLALPLVLLCRWFYFAVGFNQRTQEASLQGALAPLTCQENTKKMRLKPAWGLVFY